MSRTLHREFINTAATFSKPLATDLRAAGPITIPDRRGRGLSQFLARVIIGQQLSTKAAATIWDRLLVAAKSSGDGIPAFFDPANEDALRACGVSNNKARALYAIHEAKRDGILEPRKLRRLDIEARHARLIELRGVGKWTADIANLFYFRETDVWPDGDLAVVKVFDRYLKGAQKKTRRAIGRALQPQPLLPRLLHVVPRRRGTDLRRGAVTRPPARYAAPALRAAPGVIPKTFLNALANANSDR